MVYHLQKECPTRVACGQIEKKKKKKTVEMYRAGVLPRRRTQERCRRDVSVCVCVCDEKKTRKGLLLLPGAAS